MGSGGLEHHRLDRHVRIGRLWENGLLVQDSRSSVIEDGKLVMVVRLPFSIKGCWKELKDPFSKGR